jgi:hypothetical protein
MKASRCVKEKFHAPAAFSSRAGNLRYYIMRDFIYNRSPSIAKIMKSKRQNLKWGKQEIHTEF